MLRVCAYQKRRSLRISTSFGSSPCSVWRVKSSLASWLRVLRVYFNFLLSNKYINTSVQKGGISGVPGCLEHTGVVTQLIREAREWRGGSGCTVAGPHQRLWLNTPHAGGGCTGETPCTAEGERSHPGLLQQVQLESLYWPANIWLAPAWGGDNHWVYHLSDPLCAGNGCAGQGSWNRVQRPPQQVWSKATSHKSLHGRPHSDNNGGTGSQVGPSGVGETHVMGTYEL